MRPNEGVERDSSGRVVERGHWRVVERGCEGSGKRLHEESGKRPRKGPRVERGCKRSGKRPQERKEAARGNLIGLERSHDKPRYTESGKRLIRPLFVIFLRPLSTLTNKKSQSSDR